MTSNIKFYILIVLYKCELNESQTFKTLNLLPESILGKVKLIVWDNSPSNFQLKNDYNTGVFGGFKYIRSNKNESLSIIYNKVMNEDFNSEGFFSILDQDTSIPFDFLSAIEDANVDDRLIVPRVFSIKNNSLISPRYYEYTKPLYRAITTRLMNKDDSGLHCTLNFFAVGSGLTIPKRIFDQGLRFEEQLSFYGVDTEYCQQYSLLKNDFFLLDVDFKHDVSDDDFYESFSIKKWRYYNSMDYLKFVLAKRFHLSKTHIYFLILIRLIFFHLKSMSKSVRRFLMKYSK